MPDTGLLFRGRLIVRMHGNGQNESRWLGYVLASLVGLVAPVVEAGARPEGPAQRHVHENLRDLVRAEALVTKAEDGLASPTISSPQALEGRRRSLLGALQGLASARAFAGDAEGANEAFDRRARLEEQFHGAKTIGDERADLARIAGSHAEDAVTAIVHAARSRQVVILNEMHHVPFDRIFAMRLARALRKEGFDYLACETFSVDDEHVLEKGYVAEKTGVFSREPMFVRFLMDARQDGWKFVSYEPDVPGQLRESGMARNLIKRIFAVDPKARVFVYAGYSHAKKLPVARKDDDSSKLAAQLRRLTGIDPLTINQTTLYAHDDGAQQSRYYSQAARKLRGRQPAVLMGGNGKPISLSMDDAAYDFEVVHPAYTRDPVTGRPTWMEGLSSQPRDVPSDMLPTKGRRLVYAYRQDAPADAAPYDVVMLVPGEPAPKLMLPDDAFVLEYED